MSRDGLFRYDGDDRELQDSGTLVEVEGEDVGILLEGDTGGERA